MFDYVWLVDDDGVEYTDASWYPMRGEITRIVVAETVSSIGANAFADCYNVIHVSIPEQITDIGEGAFEGCGAADSATLADISTDMVATGNAPAPLDVAPSGEISRYSVLALDVSGSMEARPIEAQKTAAIRYCEAMLNASGCVAVITFGSSVSIACGFTSDIDVLKSAINGIRANGKTNTNGALQKAHELLQSTPANANKSIILCSDGLPNTGGSSTSGPFTSSDHSSYDHANAVCKTFDAIKGEYAIYTLGFFHSLSGKNKVFAEKFMETIQNSGYFSITNPDDLELAFVDVFADLRGKDITLTLVPGFGAECNCTHSDLCNSGTCGTDCECYNVHCYQQQFKYSDEYFTRDTSRRSLFLEQLSLGLAYAAYSYQCDNESEEHKEHKNRDFDWSVHDALTQMEFDYFDSYGYPNHQEYGLSAEPNKITGNPDPVLGKEDTIACAFAVRTPEEGGAPIIAVAVRGGAYHNEWSGNFEIGETVTIGGFVFHKNFLQSAMSVLYRLNHYIQELKDKEHVADLDKARVWVVGYSRGAAVANVTAHLLTESSIHTNKEVTVTPGVKVGQVSNLPIMSSQSFNFPNLGFDESQIYAYTFATPAAVSPAVLPYTPKRERLEEVLGKIYYLGNKNKSLYEAESEKSQLSSLLRSYYYNMFKERYTDDFVFDNSNGEVYITPMCFFESPRDVDRYIHNRIGYSDFVPMLVMEKWRYQPFGDTKYLPHTSSADLYTAPQFIDSYHQMKDFYEDIFSRSGRGNQADSTYEPDDNRHNVMNILCDLAADQVGNTSVYYGYYQNDVMRFAHNKLGVIVAGEDEVEVDVIALLTKLLFGKNNAEAISTWVSYFIRSLLGTLIEFYFAPYRAEMNSLKATMLADAATLKLFVPDDEKSDYAKFRSKLQLNYDCLFDQDKQGKYRLKDFTENLKNGSSESDTIRIMLEPIIVEFLQDNCTDPFDYKRLATMIYESLLQLLDVDNLGGFISYNVNQDKVNWDIKQEHYPEVYLSWLMNMPSYAVNAEDIGGKVMRIKCPTDVYVYDGSETCIASVVNDVVTEEQIPVTVNDRSEKTIYLPPDDDISVRITATGDGAMDVTVTEYADSNTVSHRTMYSGVSLTNGQQFGVGVEGGQNGAVTLTSGTVTVMPTLTVNGDGLDGTLVTLDPNDGSMKTASALTNESGNLGILPSPTRSGYTFSGWYTNPNGGDKVTTNTVFSQEATIYAQWAYINNNYNNAGSSGTSGSSGSSSDSSSSRPTYLITIPKVNNGSVSLVKSTRVAYRNDNITLNAVPDDGFMLESISVTKRKDEAVALTKNDDGSYSFVMPAENVTVNAAFELKEQPIQYKVSVAFSPNGIITVSPTNASAGTTITVSVLPNNGYSLNTLNYMDDTGRIFTIQGNDFIMPEHNVTVNALFSHGPFSDVTDGPFYDAILWAYQRGVTTGTSPNTFSPNQPCTRAQTVTFLWRSAGSPNPSSYYNPFSDVSESAYYYNAVLWAMEKGITRGTTATTFSPDDRVRRGQVVTFLYRWNDNIERTSSYAFRENRNPFSDVWNGPDIYFYEPVLWAVGMGITNGIMPTTFAPNEICTRGQIVTFIYRFGVSREMNQAPVA